MEQINQGPASEPQKVFDRKFVVAACTIGIGYAVFMALLAFLTKPEIAGAAGVALTSVATAIFKQFENLRFRHVSEAQGIDVKIVKLRPGSLIAALVTYALIIIVVPGLVIALPILLLTIPFNEIQQPSDAGRVISAASFNLGVRCGTIWWAGLVFQLVAILSHFFFGMVCASVATKRVAYWYAIITSLAWQLFSTFLGVLVWIKANNKWATPPDLKDGMWSAAYVAAAFCGALIWSRRREKRSQKFAVSP